MSESAEQSIHGNSTDGNPLFSVRNSTGASGLLALFFAIPQVRNVVGNIGKFFSASPKRLRVPTGKALREIQDRMAAAAEAANDENAKAPVPAKREERLSSKAGAQPHAERGPKKNRGKKNKRAFDDKHPQRSGFAGQKSSLVSIVEEAEQCEPLCEATERPDTQESQEGVKPDNAAETDQRRRVQNPSGLNPEAQGFVSDPQLRQRMRLTPLAKPLEQRPGWNPEAERFVSDPQLRQLMRLAPLDLEPSSLEGGSESRETRHDDPQSFEPAVEGDVWGLPPGATLLPRLSAHLRDHSPAISYTSDTTVQSKVSFENPRVNRYLSSLRSELAKGGSSTPGSRSRLGSER